MNIAHPAHKAPVLIDLGGATIMDHAARCARLGLPATINPCQEGVDRAIWWSEYQRAQAAGRATSPSTAE